MNIIFGYPQEQLPEQYTILELDTFKQLDSDTSMTAYCVVEVVPLADFPLLDAHKKIHADLIHAYRNRHWRYCEQAIEQLTGKWNGDLDTFYADLSDRVKTHAEHGVSDDWDGRLIKS